MAELASLAGSLLLLGFAFACSESSNARGSSSGGAAGANSLEPPIAFGSGGLTNVLPDPIWSS